METKRLVIAIAIAACIFVGWNLLFPKEQPVPPVNTETQQQVAEIIPGDQITAAAAETTAVAVESRKITIDHPLYIAEFDEQGAVITSFKLKKYHETADDTSPYKELLPQDFGLKQVGINPAGAPKNSWNNAMFTANADSDTIVINAKQTLVFTYTDQNGIKIEKSFTFNPDTYVIDFDTFLTNLSEQPWNNAVAFELEGIDQSVIKTEQLVAGTAAMFKGKLTQFKTRPKDFKKAVENQEPIGKVGNVDWMATQTRYFMLAFIPNVPTEMGINVSPNTDDTHTTSAYTAKFQLNPGETQKISNLLFFGPKEIDALKAVGHNLSRAVSFGFLLDYLAKPFLWFMKKIYSVIPNYGVAIILLTIVIKLILFPLGSKSYRSMAQMKKLSPLIKEIQEKYKDDKMRVSQETMALYKTYKINPMKGCLPLIVQLPVFFALYRMLYTAIELHHTPFIGWITDLSAPDRLFHFGFSIPFMADPTGIPVLTLLMGASMFLQQKLSPPMGDPAQARVMMFMPLIFTVIFINFSSGLVLYWLVNNLFSITQQYYIQKTVA